MKRAAHGRASEQRSEENNRRPPLLLAGRPTRVPRLVTGAGRGRTRRAGCALRAGGPVKRAALGRRLSTVSAAAAGCGTRLVDGHHLASVVEPVGLRAQHLHLVSGRRQRGGLVSSEQSKLPLGLDNSAHRRAALGSNSRLGRGGGGRLLLGSRAAGETGVPPGGRDRPATRSTSGLRPVSRREGPLTHLCPHHHGRAAPCAAAGGGRHAGGGEARAGSQKGGTGYPVSAVSDTASHPRGSGHAPAQLDAAGQRVHCVWRSVRGGPAGATSAASCTARLAANMQALLPCVGPRATQPRRGTSGLRGAGSAAQQVRTVRPSRRAYSLYSALDWALSTRCQPRTRG